MKYFKKKTEKLLVLKYPEIRSYVSTIPWSYKKKIVNRPVLYTRHYGSSLRVNDLLGFSAYNVHTPSLYQHYTQLTNTIPFCPYAKKHKKSFGKIVCTHSFGGIVHRFWQIGIGLGKYLYGKGVFCAENHRMCVQTTVPSPLWFVVSHKTHLYPFLTLTYYSPTRSLIPFDAQNTKT